MPTSKSTDVQGARLTSTPGRDTAAVIGELVFVSHKLARLAASVTGNTESPAVWRTLAVLGDAGPMRLGELARASRVSQPTMTKIVRTLDERNWVRRIADSSDARAWLISLDPRGTAALAAWRDELSRALAPWFDGLSHDELDTIARAAALVRSRVEADIDASGVAA